MIIELYNTQMQKVKELEKKNLESYLVQNSLVCKKINIRSAYVVFKDDLENIVDKIFYTIENKIETDEIKVITMIESKEQLIQDMLQALNFYKIVVFRVTKSSMRYFFSFSGFLTAMKEVESGIPQEKICLHPGCYGVHTLFVLNRNV